MASRSYDSLVVYFSPNGSTRLVGQTIAEALLDSGSSVDILDLGSPKDRFKADACLKTIEKYHCIWVGSPIYSNHALPQVMDFIDRFPTLNAGAVPFATYGEVTSGMGLYEMGCSLVAKGCRILGAAKVLALHSMMWMEDNPLGEGHPNEEDLEAVRKLVITVMDKLSRRTLEDVLDPETLNYQNSQVQETCKTRSLEVLKNILPPTVLAEEQCTRCGACAEECPTGNVSLDPYPRFGDDCVVCFNCIRSCAPGALSNQLLAMIGPELRKRAVFFGEPARTRTFA